MQINNLNIIEQLERMAEACPWQRVEIWTKRYPDGAYDFTSYADAESNYGIPAIWGHGATPEEAANDLIKGATTNTPEMARAKKIKELQEQIAALQSVVIGLPPYRPGRELANGEERTINAQPTINV